LKAGDRISPNLRGIVPLRLASALLLAAALVTAACSPSSRTSGQAVSDASSQAVVPPNPWELPQYAEHPLETERAAEDFGGQLVRACYAEVVRLNPQGLPARLTPEIAIENCARRKLFRVANDPVGEKACRNEGDLARLSKCLMMGALSNRIRVNVGSPTLLTEAEWRDTELAKRNLISEMIAQAFAQCTTGDSATMERCQFGIINKAVNIGKVDMDFCMTRGNYAASCLIDKGVAKFFRDMSMLLWD
jgi:hypothetical protein